MEVIAPQIRYMKEEANTVPLINVKNTEGKDKNLENQIKETFAHEEERDGVIFIIEIT